MDVVRLEYRMQPQRAAAPSRDDLDEALAFARERAKRAATRRVPIENLLPAAIDAVGEAAIYWSGDRGAFGPYARVCVRRALNRVFRPNPRARRDPLDARTLSLSTSPTVETFDGDRAADDPADTLLPATPSVEQMACAVETLREQIDDATKQPPRAVAA